jgi:hypothetical protein
MPLRDKITEIYIDFDDYLKEKFPNANRKHSFTNLSKLSLSEMASIEIGYHQSVYKCFKYYYQEEILVNLKSYFPNAVSYERFVALKYRVKPYLESFLRDTRLALPTDANFIDSSKLEVCHIMRAPSNKVFKEVAKHGKTIMGYFYGFKFHIIINHFGQLVDVFISAGNVADNNKVLLRKITENFTGLLIGDKGYITSLKNELLEKGINLVTKTRKNMEQIKYTPRVEYYKRHRGLIETTNDLVKNKANIQHTRHRNKINFEVNIWAALIAYTYNDKLPSIKTFMQVQKPLDPFTAALALKIVA